VKLPKKRYYSIGEVCKYCRVEPYTLRYWESRIADLEPVRLSSNRRHYTLKMIDTILCLRELIIEKKFTIDGAASAMKLKVGKESSVDSLLNRITSIIEEDS